jgi:hypothetical protein
MSNTERFIRRTKEKLGRAHDGIFIGGVDWSLNESKVKKNKPYWCSHIHGVTVTNDAKVLKKKLKKQFPPTTTIPRPIHVQEWDGETAALRYPMKPKFDRRISTDNATRFDKKTGQRRKCRDTDHQPLKSKDKLKLLLHLDAIGIAGRLVQKKVQFMNLNSTGPTFRDTPSKARTHENEGKGELAR